MARYIRHPKLRGSYRVLCTADWHVGSKAFHEDAARGVVDRLKAERDCYLIFGGDAVEGKRVDSPHFNPEALDAGHLNIKAQFDWWCDLLHPVRRKVLAVGEGNHDLYISRDFDCVGYACDRLGVPRGGYQTWVRLGDVLVHVYHGRRTMPRGAKDPVQREANQKAWLVNLLAPLAGDANVQLMGHTHALLVQPPIDRYDLLSEGDDVRGRYFREPPSEVDGCRFVPPQARWYGSMGTLRRSGGFGWTDYSEVMGYPPAPIGYLLLTVERGRVVGLEKVVV